MKWKFQGIIESVHESICSGNYGPELIKDLLFHIMSKAYQMGADDNKRNPIPFTDLSYIPELFENVKHRWQKEICN